MQLSTIDHINIQTADLDKTCWFYESILGLRRGFRPDFPFPGEWLYIEDRPVVHLIGLSADDQPVPKGSGSINHFAFAASGLDELVERLKKARIEHRVRDVPGIKLRQLFVHDPNDILVELNFTGTDAEGERLEVFRP